MAYIGRFAPSPTGPLHFGSLVAAVASYCDAKANQGKWLLRIENVDTTREVAGATEQIIDCLKAYGFAWDDEVLIQNERSDIYQSYLDQLIEQQLAYRCNCTRKAIAEQNPPMGLEGYIYPRTCFKQSLNARQPTAWRMHVGDKKISFQDRCVGIIEHDMASEIGDFVLKRADGIYSYHLAVAVDDALQGVTHVVRGEDLLHSTSRQIMLQEALNLPTPEYMHIPIVKNAEGEKLSKQTLAPAIDEDNVIDNLFQAFKFLQLNPPSHLRTATINQLWDWAFTNWQHATLTK